MALAERVRDSFLDNFASLAQYVSLHTADPGQSGRNELSGGAPPYGRQPISWTASRGANTRSAVEVVFEVPAGSVLRFVCYWTWTGEFVGSRALNKAQPFETQGIFTLRAADIGESLS